MLLLALEKSGGEVRKTLLFLIGMTVAGLLILITLLAVSNFPATHF